MTGEESRTIQGANYASIGRSTRDTLKLCNKINARIRLGLEDCGNAVVTRVRDSLLASCDIGIGYFLID